MVKEHLVEFNQIAMANAEGSDDMLNRVMTKDNIGLAALLETKEAIFENGQYFVETSDVVMIVYFVIVIVVPAICLALTVFIWIYA